MQTIPKDIRDAARAYVETHTADDAPRYYRFGVASNLRRRIITTQPQPKPRDVADLAARVANTP